MSVIRLELPFPPKELSPNARVNRWVKPRIVRQYREACGWAASLECRERTGYAWYTVEPPVEATVTFVVPDRRKRDEDNLLAMLKPAWDGLVDAGVLVGDDHANFKVVKTEVVVRHDRWVPVAGSRLIAKSQPCVIVELVSRVGAGHG